MKQYLDLLRHVLDHGHMRPDRTGTGTLSVFGYQARYDLEQGFPVVTTKRLAFKTMAHELLWFLSGDTNTAYLKANGVRIWDAWADDRGDLGPVYGEQWRSWGLGTLDLHDSPIDQIANVIESIKRDPYSRRHIVSAWNVGDLEYMELPPCHLLFQFYVHDGRLSCHLYQRSGDAFLGVPFNIASYALLTHMIAQVCGLKVGEFVHSFGDLHIYANHVEQVREQVARTPHMPPSLRLDPSIKHIDDFRIEHIALEHYCHDPAITAPVAV